MRCARERQASSHLERIPSASGARDVPRDGVDPPSDILGRFGPDRHASHAGVCHRPLFVRLACQALV